jgi:nucleoside-triphosphatase THEP1
MRMIPNEPANARWLKAAVIGSLWASFEIIAGSFLHNLRIPFSGTLLTALSVFLVIAFFQLWDDRGIIWRAGLICAIMKSLSPSAVIIGPMVGILTESVIIWFFIVVFGRNPFSYILGGAFAVVSALFHKVVSLLFLYGFNLVKIADGMYKFSARQLRIENPDPAKALAFILLLYMLLGASVALIGYFSGRKLKKILPGDNKSMPGGIGAQSTLFKHSSSRRYSLAALVGHLVLIVLCLWLLNTANYYVSISICLVYIIVCLAWYHGAMRFLKKSGFWIQFAVITLIAAIFIEGFSTGNYLSINGLIIGLEMNLRAFVVMAGFTAISIELKNPLVRTVLYNSGFASIYQSLSLAFSALPDIIATMPKAREFFKDKRLVLLHLFASSHELLARFQEDQQNRALVVILSGRVGQGKTTFLSALIEKMKVSGIYPAGILAPGHFIDGLKDGFWMEDISGGQRRLLASKHRREGWTRAGHYCFDPLVLQAGNDILTQAVKNKPAIIIIDEVGPMEMNDRGWAPAIDTLCSGAGIPQLWIVRKSLAEKAARKWNVGDVYLFDLDEDQLEDVMKVIEKIRK